MNSKNYSRIRNVAITLMLLFSVTAYSQISLTGEVRPRFEYRNGFKTLRPEGDAFKPASFVEQRTRLYFNFQKDKLKLHIALQDVRMWGNHNQIYKTENNLFNIYEGYGEYQFTQKWAFKVGRQALNYDNARFFGNLDWAQQGRSHDAFLFRFNSNNGLKGDIGVALNNSGSEPTYLMNDLYMMNNYKNMQFLYLQKKFEKASFSLIIENDGSQLAADSVVYYSQTFGLTGKGNITENLELAGEFFYQSGDLSSTMDIAAYMYSISLTYKTKLTPITLGLDNLSGTAIDEASTSNSFNPKYGTNHKFYGFMDYFYVGNAHGQGNGVTGLTDIHLKTKFKLAEKHSLVANVHYFLSPVSIYSDVTDLTTEMNNGLGTEIDLVYGFRVAPDVNMQFGYSHMFATETMEAVKGSIAGSSNATNNWGWIMIQFKPELYNSKKKKAVLEEI